MREIDAQLNSELEIHSYNTDFAIVWVYMYEAGDPLNGPMIETLRSHDTTEWPECLLRLALHENKWMEPWVAVSGELPILSAYSSGWRLDSANNVDELTVAMALSDKWARDHFDSWLRFRRGEPGPFAGL